MRVPDFFVLGAPKCGTTSLARYLGEHERIFMSEPKEPHFFNTDFANRHTTDIDAYRDCFREAQNQHLAVGEASVLYLYSREAVGNIVEFAPTARFIVSLRNPVDLAYAYHSQSLRSNGEMIADFEKAWRLQFERKSGAKVPTSCREKKVLLYGELAAVGHQLRRLFEQVERERVLILFMDDLKRDPVSVYRQALDFLDVPYDGRQEFPIHNANQQLRSPRLRRLVEYAYGMKRRLGIQRGFGVLNGIKRLNVEATQREAMRPEFRKELIDYFDEDIELVEQLTGRNLSEWRRI